MGFKDNEIMKNNNSNIAIDKVKKINNYTKNFTNHDNPELKRIFEEESKKKKLSPIVEPEVGRFLNFYIRSIQAQKVLELGTGIGYSTIWLAEALKYTNGKLISLELDNDKYNLAKENIKKAGLNTDLVELILQDAINYIDSLIQFGIKEKFDLIFIDLEKTLYPDLVERCIKIVSLNGAIIADDTLFKPKGLRKKVSDPVDKYNKQVFADKRLYSSILPIGDGLTLSLKLSL